MYIKSGTTNPINLSCHIGCRICEIYQKNVKENKKILSIKDAEN